MRFLFGLMAALMLATMSQAQTYNLEVGDVLAIEVLEDASLNRNTLVLPDGNISFPFAGNVRAAGRTVSQVQQSLITALAPNFATAPTVFVSINQLNSPPSTGGRDITIYVIGEVNNPGEKELEKGTTFLQALASVGGFTSFAATKRIQLRRTDPSTGQEAVYSFNLRAAGDGAKISGNATLLDGDVILVPERRLFE
ncbi:polysaccharide biosynthesis/export family protein [Meridianimarinicoccus aquatilis]|uniref:Polysaccharide export protein n=1 Tax=Meridianimarinicoccus aquatilis TaxID=2552766 RepID=A0A4R6B2Z7_9RHOB|nr:polysaccharide biosynthesis/export family protein [Fluviibacterium aquatile]QIE41253.1 polysaccharide export protein [Rhodobacteraceae bacterium SC52]TDL90595.1 polysaccharide export protein [Fluviibacterium aquatile]